MDVLPPEVVQQLEALLKSGKGFRLVVNGADGTITGAEMTVFWRRRKAAKEAA